MDDRLEVNNMDREEVLNSIHEKILKSNAIENITEHEMIVFVELIQSLKTKTCESCISRNAVEKITWEKPSYTDPLNVLTEIREKIRQLPSVKPLRRKGSWIEYEKDKGIECSECCKRFDFSENMTEDFDFCPNCGSYNRDICI